MSKYDAIAARAHNTIARKGGRGVITRKSSTADPVAQTATISEVTANFVAVAVDVNLKFATELFGSLLNRTIARIYVSNYGLSLAPMPADDIRWAGYDWNVKWAKPVDPAGDGAIVTDVYMER